MLDEQQKPVETSTQTSPAPETPIKTTSAKKSVSHKKLIIGFFVFAALALSAMGVTAGVYLQPPTSGFVRAVTGVLPYPAVVVDGRPVSINDYLAEYDALVNYFTLAAPGEMPSEAELESNIVDTLINKTAIQNIARSHGIVLDPVREEEFFQQVVAQSGEEAFATQLSETFGWTPEEFRARVVGSVVLATQVGEWIASDAQTQTEARSQADGALTRLQAGEDFAIVAGDTSQDFSAAQGGDIGYVTRAELPETWGPAVADLEVGAHSSVVESPEAFLIFSVTDRIAGEDEQIKLSVIVLPKKTLDEVVAEYLDSVKVWRLLGEKEA